MKKFIRILLCTALLSGAMLLSQGCETRGEHEAAPEDTRSDASRQSELDSDVSDSNTEDSDTTTAYKKESASDAESSDHAAGGAADSSADRTSSGQSQEETKVPGPACPSLNGALRVDSTQLVDKNGHPVQLRGISTHGLAWFPDYVNEDCFRQLREDWQANVIRLAMYTAEYGGYCTGGDREALKKLIHDGVSFAERQDLYAIIDWHILSDSNPNMYLEEAKAFFGEMAEKYAESDHVLYEICNEPNGGTSWGEIKAYAEQVISVIRAQDEDAVILVGTPNWSQYIDQAAADPIASYENIMYTLHFYAATHTDDLRRKLIGSVESGLPVFVSEYGICDASGNGAIDTAQADLWIETLDKYGISYIAWNLSNKDETSAILKSGCGKASGFTQEDLSESGRWVYRMLRKYKGEIGILFGDSTRLAMLVE